MKRLELEEMEGVNGGVIISTSPCMNAMAEWGLAFSAAMNAAQADNPAAFWSASYKAAKATEKMDSACNAA